MSAARISRVEIENFKSIERLTVDVRKDVVILDGPNGFGKTGFFDALELAFLGKISRIEDSPALDRRKAYLDPPYFKDSNKDIIIRVQMEREDGSSFVIIKKRSAQNVAQRSNRNSPLAWGEFKTYVTDKLDESMEDKVAPVTPEKILQELGIRQVADGFHLFYYIQQEERGTFLKRKERDRLKELSVLFNTETQQKELTKVRQVRSVVTRKISKLEEQITIRKGLLESQAMSPSENETAEQIQYQPIFDGVEERPQWDQDLMDKSVTEDMRRNYLAELAALETMVIDFGSLQIAWHVQTAKRFVASDDILRAAVVLGHFRETLPEMERTSASQHEWVQFKRDSEKLDRFTWLDDGGFIERAVSLSEELFQTSRHTLMQQITDINSKRQNLNELSRLANQINQNRGKLTDDYSKLHHLHSPETDVDGTCPLCGHIWGNMDILMQNIDRQQHYFNQFLSKETTETNDTATRLYETYVVPVIQHVDSVIQSNEFISRDFMRQLQRNTTFLTHISELIHFCKIVQIDLSPMFHRSHRVMQPHEISSKVAEIKQRLDRFILDNAEIESKYEGAIIERTKYLFETYLHRSKEQVVGLEPARIVNKRAYIDQAFYRTNGSEVSRLTAEISALKHESEQYEAIAGQLEEMAATIDSLIRQHWSKVIHDIEIVFYVYFARITHYYQRGLGMFIQQGDELTSGTTRSADEDWERAKSIKFTHGSHSEHDALHFLSSGQLSALVIAFTLSLHKVYATDGLAVLMIDDPVQTMDDINMASFVELLRNDFDDRQMFLSTHEDNVSQYFDYKFSNYHRTTKRISMKEMTTVSAT